MKIDEVGPWSEVKIEIIKKYASAYTYILSKQKFCSRFLYIDAFAGAGKHISKDTKEEILGSPREALKVISKNCIAVRYSGAISLFSVPSVRMCHRAVA